jgi:CysZ protein
MLEEIAQPVATLPPPVTPLLRASEGGWHVVAGFAFLLRHPRLWLLASGPALLAGLALVCGPLLGLFAAWRLERLLGPAPGQVGAWLGLMVTATIWSATILAVTALGFGLALLAAAPVLDRLSREVEVLARPGAVEAVLGLRWEVAQSLRRALYFLVRAPLVFLLGLVPFLGPALAALWAAHALAFQLTDPALARRGLGFEARREWHRRFRAESLGFGLLALFVLLVPCANLLLAPALVVGATLLVLELQPPPA